jgi:glutamate dehydrogenase
LRHNRLKEGLEPEIERYRHGVGDLIVNMAAVQPEHAKIRVQEEEARLSREGLPEDLANRIASLEPLTQALDIVHVANETRAPIVAAARTVFSIRDKFRLDELASAAEALAAGDYFNRLAINSSLAAVASAQSALAKSVIANSPQEADFDAWMRKNAGDAARVANNLASMLGGRALTLAKLTVCVAQLRDLAAA